MFVIYWGNELLYCFCLRDVRFVFMRMMYSLVRSHCSHDVPWQFGIWDILKRTCVFCVPMYSHRVCPNVQFYTRKGIEVEEFCAVVIFPYSGKTLYSQSVLLALNSWPTFSPYLYNRVCSELTCCNSLSHSRLACSRLSAHTSQAWTTQIRMALRILLLSVSTTVMN